MQKKSINQVQLSKKTGIHQTTISNWLIESDRGKLPSLKNLITLAKALNCSLDELAGTNIPEFEKLKNIPNQKDEKDKLLRSAPDEAIELMKRYIELDDDDPKKIAIEALLLKRDTKSENTKDENTDK